MQTTTPYTYTRKYKNEFLFSPHSRVTDYYVHNNPIVTHTLIPEAYTNQPTRSKGMDGHQPRKKGKKKRKDATI